VVFGLSRSSQVVVTMSSTLELNYLVLGNDPNHIFMIKFRIPTISGKPSRTGRQHIDDKNVSFPVNGSLKENLSKLVDEGFVLPVDEFS